MLIDCGDGDYRDVQKVYWCATEPDEIEVFFKDETARNLDYWTRGGWQTNDLAPPAPSSKVRKDAARAPLKGANQ
ncbi:hypothetical protein AB7849_19000 [Rhodanobacter sp. 115]|uniref:hypothetical protein n=1 Tax=Rhodanobacter sp. FW021-MT20 TaxID=1162282 RepID=UPI0034E4502E